MTERELFAGTALSIGRRLAGAAVWNGDACAWPLAGGDPHPGNVYRGSAGVALFLAELARVTGDAECRRAAAGAARHAARWSARVTAAHPGLFNGRVGVGWAVARVGASLGLEEHLRDAADAARWAAGTAPPRYSDVIEGIAGVVLALVQMAPLSDDTGALDTAAAWGRALLARAVPEPWGWSWPTSEPGYVRNLLGYAHGVSGVGHALLELAAATGDGAFRHAAEQAFLYERRFHRPELGNWADFRYAAADTAPGGERAPAPYHPHFRAAWCHGATGIGLARVRAAELLGAPVYAAEARSAAAAARRYPLGPGTNFSLCHGVAGTVELLAEAARALREPPLLEAATALAADGCERFERAGVPWPCGTRDGSGDPGLMLGEAGIGLMLLRLADPAIGSVLLPRAPGAPRLPGDGGPAAARLAGESARAHFGGALAAFARLDRAPGPPAGRGQEPAPLALHHRLDAIVAAEPDPALRALLADALAPERAAFEMELGAIDRTEEGWRSAGAAEPAWEHGWIALSPHARVVETAHDWAAWPADAANPPDGPAVWLVVRRDNQARAHRLEPFAAAVLAALEPARTLDGVVEEVAGGFPPGSRPSPERLRAAIAAQLRAAWRMGAVAVDAEPPLDAGLRRLAAAAAGDAPPAAIQARDVVARQVEWARERLDGDPLLAQLVALTGAAELEATLHAIHARVLFADRLAAVHDAPSPQARLDAFRALLDAVGGAFRTAEVFLPGVQVRG